jgi:protease-4
MTKATRKGMLIIGSILVVLTAIGFMARSARQPARGSVVEIHLGDDIPEWIGDESLADLFGGGRLILRDYLEAIQRAGEDERINGLLVTIDDPPLGFARLQEVRDAILRFRASGKWAAAYMETAGEFSPGNAAYYLASAFSSIWLAPPGDINLTGLRAEIPFVRGALDKLKVFPDMDHIGEYKNAMNLFTHKEMTPEHRESVEALIEAYHRQMRDGIAAGRGKEEDEVAALIDRGPFLGPQALEVGLVDHLGYRDEMEAKLKEENGGALPLIPLRRYLKGGRYYDRGPKVALIYGIGSVLRGESTTNPLTGESVMGSDTIVEAFERAREDDSIEAIVFRVDSPGGSYVASDLIWREVTRTTAVKPVVVSMANLAGSGGYFVAMAAQRIVAEPGTITASIGVLAGKFVTTALWNTLGITSDSVQRGRHATFFSREVAYTPEERVIFRGWLERIYKDFVGKVAEGRGMTFDEVHAIAQGRIWAGEDARSRGLVDELGGLDTAIRAALDLAGKDPDGRARLVVIPEPKSWFEKLRDRDDTAALLTGALRAEIERIVLGDRPYAPERVLEMPFVPVVH